MTSTLLKVAELLLLFLGNAKMGLPGIGVFGTDTSTNIIVPLLKKEVNKIR